MAAHRMIARDIRLRRRLPRPRLFLDRQNPLEVLAEDEVFSRYRFRPPTIMFICEQIVHIDRQTSRSFPVPLLLAVLAYLRFLATGGFQLTVADTVRLSQPTVSRLCQQVGRAISQMARQFITFPEGDAARRTKQIFGTLAGFPNVLGAIDCTHIWIKKPSMNPEDFIGRKGVPTINVQVVCDASFRITSAVVMWPGRTHDSRIWRQCALRARFEQGDHQGFLVADSGYQCTRYMLTPYLTPQIPAQVRYNTALCRTRVIVEQTFGVLKQRFQILRRKINLRPERACMHIKNAVILHNIGIERGDILAGVVQDAQVEENDQLEDVPADAAGRVMRDYITDSYFN